MNEQQQMIKDALERILTDLCTADVVNAAEAGEWPEELWQALTETGLTLAGISEQTGGTGGDVTDSLLVIREAARFAAPVPLAEHFLAARLLESSGMTVSQPVMTVAIGEFEFNSNGGLTGQADHVAFARWADEIILVAVRKSRPFVCRVNTSDIDITRGTNLAGEPVDAISVDLNLPDDKTQTPLNINKKLTKLSAFGNWGVKQGLMSANPFRDMKLEVKKSRTQRQPFTPAELKKILKPELYLDNTINYSHPIYKSGGVKNGLPYYWVFILGIFSGLRTNEMAQMRLEDIKKESNIWFLHVEESEQTRVKTENAIRKVPVHPQLIDLGFIDYVGNLKRKRKDRVFWELTQTRDGYAKQVSRHYNEKYLPAVGVWEKRVKVLYCTRHTFINCLYSKKVDENVIKSLVGHEKEFTMKHYGGDPFSTKRLFKDVSKVNYKGIKWDDLKIV